MRGKVCAGKLDRQLRALRYIVERNPCDMVLNCVWMRDFLANGDFDLVCGGWGGGRGDSDDRDVLLSLPVSGFDVLCYHIFI